MLSPCDIFRINIRGVSSIAYMYNVFLIVKRSGNVFLLLDFFLTATRVNHTVKQYTFQTDSV